MRLVCVLGKFSELKQGLLGQEEPGGVASVAHAAHADDRAGQHRKTQAQKRRVQKIFLEVILTPIPK